MLMLPQRRSEQRSTRRVRTSAVQVAALLAALVVVSPVQSQSKLITTQLKTVLGHDFADYEKVLGKPITVRQSVEPIQIMGQNGPQTIGETKAEVRFYRVPDFDKVVVSIGQDSELKYGMTRGSRNGIPMKGITHRVRFQFKKGGSPRSWQEAIARFGLAPTSGVMIKNPDDLILSYKLYEQWSPELFGNIHWEPSTKSLIFWVEQ